MKRSKKIAIMLITALVMTASMVVVAFAEILYLPQYSSASDRYTQVFEITAEYNWKTTLNMPIDNWYGYNEANYADYGVVKKHANRDCAVQCTYNEVTLFPTYYMVYQAYSDAFPFTLEKSMIGTGYTTIDFLSPENAVYMMCLGVRQDPRASYGPEVKGNWSPDTYN